MDLVFHPLDFDCCTVIGKPYLLHGIQKAMALVMHEVSFTFPKNIRRIPSEGL